MVMAIPQREKDERDRCEACLNQRAHTPQEWANHPCAGHGYTRESGWTHAVLESEGKK